MPLHDWANLDGWEGVHDIWLVELLYWLKPRLPEQLQAYIGLTPALSLDAVEEKPDVAVRQWLPDPATAAAARHDKSDIAGMLMELDSQTSIHVKSRGRLVAALELVSPRNKDRPE